MQTFNKQRYLECSNTGVMTFDLDQSALLGLIHFLLLVAIMLIVLCLQDCKSTFPSLFQFVRKMPEDFGATCLKFLKFCSCLQLIQMQQFSIH